MKALHASDAIFSACGRYRYLLSREWKVEVTGLPAWCYLGTGRCLFVMLNPSTADADVDDHEVRKCISFAQAWGFLGLDIVNLFAWRTDDPRDVLVNLADASPEEADRHMMAAISACSAVVCSWGDGITGVDGRSATMERARAVLETIRVVGKIPMRIGSLTKHGQPRHPLHLSGLTKLEAME